MCRMHGVRKQHGLVVPQGIQQLFVALNESLLLFFVELARDDIGLVIFEAQAMQQCASVLSGLRKRRRIHSRSRRRLGASCAATPRRPSLSAFPVARRSTGKRCPRSRNSSAPRSHPLHTGDTKCGWCRRPATAPSQSHRSSSHRPATPARSHAGPDDERPTRSEPTRSGLAAILCPESRPVSSVR